MAVTRAGLTLDEFLALPERKPALEYAEAMVTQKVAPKGKHSGLQVAAVMYFNNLLMPRKLGRAFSELRTTWAGRSLVPDVSVYRWARIPRDERGRVANDFFEPPDLIVEIVSPKQGVNALVRRCLWYVANGVSLALLVDPDDDSVLAFRAGEPAEALKGDDVLDLGWLVPGARLKVAELFDALQMD